ncbi:ComEA family DNA-binding protein [Parabacteroides chongii]|uniref:ComEA family DNA-binding protein n=1 Tax=Parabacteroides chongii TaxID=2685834 RepID=UPI00240E8C6A|nr:helix-hairpin-helix domain-containing protein [Parabacteroides chongii]WFE86290.1 helix-hairpin-helix domain-containing protein [Parabacteroides chongii]
MNWRDLLYFSKGERRALTLLLCLISISWIILLLTDNKPAYFADENKKAAELVPMTSDTTVNRPDSGKRQIPSSDSKNNFSREKKEFHPRETKNTSERKYFPPTEKYPVGTIVELNTADTTILKKVPGIGSTFARRIVKYRELLGGFYSVSQLCEVYGIDEERYNAMKSWFSVDKSAICKLFVNRVYIQDLYRHPYINKQQARIIEQLRKQKGKLTGWENFQLLEEFTDTDKERLTPYLSFE